MSEVAYPEVRYVFDVDGVLLDSYDSTFRSYGAAFGEAGFPLTRETFNVCIWGKSWEEVVLNWPHRQVDFELVRKHRLASKMGVCVPTWIYEIYRSLRAHQVAVMTSGSEQKLREKYPFFYRSSSLVITGVNKRDADAWTRRFDVKNLVVFEDDPFVIELLQSLGATTCYVTLPRKP